MNNLDILFYLGLFYTSLTVIAIFYVYGSNKIKDFLDNQYSYSPDELDKYRKEAYSVSRIEFIEEALGPVAFKNLQDEVYNDVIRMREIKFSLLGTVLGVWLEEEAFNNVDLVSSCFYEAFNDVFVSSEYFHEGD